MTTHDKYLLKPQRNDVQGYGRLSAVNCCELFVMILLGAKRIDEKYQKIKRWYCQHFADLE